jgi:hypothetical protein
MGGGGGALRWAVCESIDEISKEEIESQKDDIKSRLINIDSTEGLL